MALALELSRPPAVLTGRLPARAVPFGVFRGLGLGVSAALAFGVRYGIVFGVLSALGLLGAYVLGSSPTLERVVDQRPGLSWLRVRATIVRGLAVGLAAAAAGVLVGRGLDFVDFAVRMGIVAGVVGGIGAATVPLVEAWANRLPVRQLGAFGVLLLILGVVLQTLQYWVTVFDVPLK